MDSTIQNNPTSAPWYSEEAGFFGPAYLQQAEKLITPEKTLQEVDFLEKALNLTPGTSLFDCPCGHGRHSIELARRGYKVTGQDLNSFFLQEAEKAAAEAGVSVRWRKGDMRDIPFEGEFDAAINMFTAFGYLESDEEDQKVLDQVAKALRPGGLFVLDTMNRDRTVRNFREKDWEELSDGSILLNERHFDHSTGRMREKRLLIGVDGRREESWIFPRMYTVAELVSMLGKAGLRVRELYGGYTAEQLSFESRRFILVSEKT